MKRLIWILVVFSSWLFAATSFCRAKSDDERLLDGLRRRRLFDLASSYCKDRLQSDSLSNIARMSLTIELVRTHASRAVRAGFGARYGHFYSRRMSERLTEWGDLREVDDGVVRVSLLHYNTEEEPDGLCAIIRQM